MSAKLRLHPGRVAVTFFGLVLGVAVAGVIASSGSSALAANVKCGDTITTDTTLHKDLVNCPNNGIIIGADNITLNLNGHTIDGDGKPFAGCAQGEICDNGVLDPVGHDGLTVKHGSVREFLFGLAVGPTRNSRVLGLSTARNRFAGIFCVRCVRSLVRNSAANRTKGDGDQVGMLFFQSHHDRILHSTFRGNAGAGILSVKSTNTLIGGNLMSDNGAEGFFMEGGDGFQIRHNRSVRNQSGIAFGPGSDNVITRNHVSRGGNGIAVAMGHDNLIAHNVVARTDIGISLGVTGAGPLSGARSMVRRNLVRDSRKDGYFVRNKDRHSRLMGNVATGSGDDGFDIESRSARLTRNRAVDNGDLGIEAVFGVNDGGGNRARHNGDPRQCTHIVCS